CQEFIDALEKACAATKGWKPLPRGASLNEPTAADAPRASAITLPRGVKPRRLGDTTVTAVRRGVRKSSFVTFLLAALVTGGLIALIALQAPPWLPTINKPETPPQPAPRTIAKQPAPVNPPPKQAPPPRQ